MTARPTYGYLLATVAAIVSGVSVYLNSLAVSTFADPVLYTALKDGLVGLVLLVPLIFSPTRRAEYRHLSRATWTWLIALALTGGSVPFALFFSGLQLTTAATGAVINHFQFVLVAVFARVFLGERLRPGLWAGFAALLIGVSLGTNLDALRWNEGAWMIAVSTILFAIDFVIAKHLLRGLATLTVMTARMTIGTAMLLVYLLVLGRTLPVSQLSAEQWTWVLVTGTVLLLFTVTTFTAIRHASVSTVLAIGTAAPVITTLVQVARSGHVNLDGASLTGLGLTLAAMVGVLLIGVRYDRGELPRVPA